MIKKGRPYDVYNIDGDILNNICEIMSPLLSHFGNVNYPYAKVFSFTADDVDKKIFHLLIKRKRHITGSYINLHTFYQSVIILRH